MKAPSGPYSPPRSSRYSPRIPPRSVREDGEPNRPIPITVCPPSPPLDYGRPGAPVYDRDGRLVVPPPEYLFPPTAEQQLRDAREGVPTEPEAVYARPPTYRLAPRPLPEPTAEYAPIPGYPAGCSPRAPSAIALPPPHSGPGTLAYQDLVDGYQQRLDEHEQHWNDLKRAAEEGEGCREEAFRDYEDERDRVFRDHEERRDREATERQDEIYNKLQDRLALPVPEPTVVTGEPGELDAPIFGSPAPSIIEPAVSSEPPSACRPAPGGRPQR